MKLGALASAALLPDLHCPARAADNDSLAAANYNWTGFYLGGHLGYGGGKSNWTVGTAGTAATIASGSLNLAQPIDSFKESGSFIEGGQFGYNSMLANHLVIGAEVDVSFPAYPDPVTGLAIGGSATVLNGAESYSENVLASGTARIRIGYAPRDWLYYVTGGLAWSDNEVTLTQAASGATETRSLSRWGWAAGGGVEAPIMPRWTARLEYLYTGYGSDDVTFPLSARRFNSDLSLQELRLGLNYRFGGDEAGSQKDSPELATANTDAINFHGQATVVVQGYPSFRSPYQGGASLSGGGAGRETTDVTLSAGLRLWQGAELWFDPEIDQGFGVGDTHGIAGYASGESYKMGHAYPYARVQRLMVRQTIDLGGETEKVDADLNQFAGSQTANRLVLTAGRFFATDLFDTNTYANNPKTDFLNWSLINAGSFDYAADGWGSTYGAAAEWKQGRWTLRGGIFSLSTTPGGGDSPLGSTNDSTFKQFELIGEVEERHEVWGQPGKFKITAFLEDGRMGAFSDAIAYMQSHPLSDPTSSINMVRRWRTRPGVSFNLEQQVTEDLGVFARAGWADGKLEPWDFTDIDCSVSAGVSVSGKRWGRPDDRVGFAGAINGISSVHEQFFNLGGAGIVVGDGRLPHPGLEKIFETYYSYALSPSTKLSLDYQFVDSPGYNTDRGPVNLFAGRLHWQF
jgi:high affinity Mn2+ porin